MNILLLTAHSIAEHDDLRMLSEMGHNVFSIGAYTDPANPTDDKRPPLPQVPYYSGFAALVEGNQMAHKAHLPAGLIDWADTIIVHHFVQDWIVGQWDRIRHKRVVWRTCGQSNPQLESFMAPLRSEGLQIVRYSPREMTMPYYAGADALIRFGKEPPEWGNWTGEDAVVGNITQNMLERGDACGYDFWRDATDGLSVSPAGPGSEQIGGVGSLSYDDMRAYLRRCRAYLYTGTQPASYTLGLIEALMTGTPVVSIGPGAWSQGWLWLNDLFEAHQFAEIWTDSPEKANAALRQLLDVPDWAAIVSREQREAAVEVFGMDAVKAEWARFLNG